MNRNNKIFLLIHTMTITESDYVVQAQFFHTFSNNLAQINDARLVGRRLSLRVHPCLSRNRGKANLQMLTAPDLKTLMKRNSAKIRHHLRTIHIPSPNNSIHQKKIDHGVSPTPPDVQQQMPILKCAPDKKLEYSKNEPAGDHLVADATPDQTINWLTSNRFEKYIQTFCSFSGADMLRMSRDDLIQICGHADGIRLYNALHLKTIAPKLKIYVCREKSPVFNAIFLSSYSNFELVKKLSIMMGISNEHIKDIYIEGPQSIHIQLSNDVLSHIKEETMFNLEVIQDNDSYILLLKRTVKQ